ncbi:MAG: hypothetical protein EHM61_09140 [Acidobacteria bacterium]|nr:MAG: hypothetical protein EHM61_09140 [Acidobacteriota bacterium]
MKARFTDSYWFPLLVLMLGFASYAWVLDNGFISDDLVILAQSEDFAFIPDHLYTAPLAFRLLAFAWFAVMQAAFGLEAVWFYVFSILLHCLNALLLRSVLVRRGADVQVAGLAALLFVIIQNPSEAIGWLAAVNELLVGSFLLGVLWATHKSRYAMGLVLYLGALFSKEAGAVACLLLPLLLLTLPGGEGRKTPPRWFWMLLAFMTAGYVAWFVVLRETNFLIQSRFYGLKPTAVLVLLFSLHKIAFPWIYLALLVGFSGARRSLHSREVVVAAGWTAISLSPYMFLTYDTHLPSRHLYLAAMPASYLIAQLVWPVGNRLRWGFVIAFAVANIGYLWLVKEPQYVARGATSRELIAILKSRPPGCVVVEKFPENPWIAKLSSRFVPGWSPQMILVNEGSHAADCLVVSWDSSLKNYTVIPSTSTSKP